MANYEPTIKFDATKGRITLDDEWVVLHCQHYNLGFVQMVLDTQDYIDGGKFMSDSAEQTTHKLLQPYAGGTAEETLAVATEMFSKLGFGKLDLSAVSEDGGTVEVPSSHIGNGWQVKYEKNSKKPTDFFAKGFVAGALSAAFKKDPGSYQVTQEKALEMGDDLSSFKAVIG